ncbi:DinB family protein [Nocardioides iriomotensis]|uniref:DinB family protein n=1 Tax=Nocardioides iriomotensis TaxID=715784 RepID=A0A4Q5J4S0_9ACTN|nr:DinB family protein [Nocardioides iriomotensis]RYU12465.1 DinB family protein [Nocardioides iriomotensis]
MSIEPDTKDWTWVLERPCPECGYDARTVEAAELPARLREASAPWRDVLAREDAAVRPADNIWSPLEYACHVRDVHRVFDGRVERMLTEDDPAFDSWDQDATALEGRYDEQDPATVAGELVAAAEAVAVRYAGVEGDLWRRTGRRSDGAVFTVDSIGRYHLHDVVHHLYDVGADG